MHLYLQKLKTYIKKYETYFKYFFSYLIIVVTLFSLFLLIFKTHLTKSYFEQRCQQTMLQLDNISERLNQNLVYLSQVDNSLKSNIKFIEEAYETTAAYKYHAYEELTQYASTTRMIQSIVYFPKKFNQVFSTSQHVTYEDGIFCINIVGYYSPDDSFVFDPTPYYNSSMGQLIYRTSKHNSYLLYFPPISSTADNVFFYILDMEEIQSQMRNCISEELPAIALIYEGNKMAFGENIEMLRPYLTEKSQPADGIWQIDDSFSICTRTTIGNDFSMVALISNDFLDQQFINTFKDNWLTFMLLGFMGVVLIMISMRITYIPLHRLTQKVAPKEDAKTDYLKLLDTSFCKVEEQNRQLKSKLNNYRISMQKSLLDSVFSTQSAQLNIDKLFDAEENNDLYLVHLASPGKHFPCEDIRNYFETVLSEKDICSVLDAKYDSAIYLLNYIGMIDNKEAVLKNLLNQLHEDNGFLAAISNGSSSPLDIPALYENVLYASRHWTEIPVVNYPELPPTEVKFTYPYETLEQLTIQLKKLQFDDVYNTVDNLFSIIAHCTQSDKRLPDFYVRCILIDMLSIITNCLNQFRIEFKYYDELYYETLYYCRSCPHEEKISDIVTNIHTLLKLYEKESSNSINPSLIRSTLEESYADPNISIALLADKFHVSIAYMSYLVRKEVDQNFSDYLWSLRLKKAKELLLTTQLSIEEISASVGYLNVSSFRRKFKQETGMTPAQFRLGE